MEREIQVVGMPQGAEILYIEDYAYSFIKIALSEKKCKSMEVILLGREEVENQKHYYYVSGIIFEEKEKEHFNEDAEIGRAIITLSSSEYPEIEIKTGKNHVTEFKDYYIYYADNDNMKNYLLSFAVSPLEREGAQAIYRTVINSPQRIESGGVGEILKYIPLVFVMAYIIISMNHYRKLEFVSEQAIYVMKTISQQTILQEDTFYTP